MVLETFKTEHMKQITLSSTIMRNVYGLTAVAIAFGCTISIACFGFIPLAVVALFLAIKGKE
jgi:hypothetical protein